MVCAPVRAFSNCAIFSGESAVLTPSEQSRTISPFSSVVSQQCGSNSVASPIACVSTCSNPFSAMESFCVNCVRIPRR